MDKNRDINLYKEHSSLIFLAAANYVMRQTKKKPSEAKINEFVYDFVMPELQKSPFGECNDQSFLDAIIVAYEKTKETDFWENPVV